MSEKTFGLTIVAGVITIICLIGYSSSLRTTITEMQDDLEYASLRAEEVPELKDRIERLTTDIGTANAEISTTRDEVDYINNTWYDTCWDLRDAVLDIPVPELIDY